MNDFIDEGIIPQNFNWRAGIGKDSSQVQPVNQFNNQTDLYDGGIKLTRVNEPVRYPYRQIDLTNQLLPEIDTQVTDVIERYNNKELNGRTLLEIKEELKKTCLNIKSKYRMYLNEGFYNALYNQCKWAYENDFSKLKENINALTEFVEVNGKLYGNPLLIYGFFQM